MKMLACSLIAALAASTQTIPPPPARPSQVKARDTTVSVRGCLHGSMLQLTEDPGFELSSKTLTLTGSRRVMRGLKEHDGHLEELLGVLKTRTPTEAVAVKEKRGDKMRIYVGVSERRSTKTETIGPEATLDVRESKHLAPACQ
jgi:hypothetical protein